MIGIGVLMENASTYKGTLLQLILSLGIDNIYKTAGNDSFATVEIVYAFSAAVMSAYFEYNR